MNLLIRKSPLFAEDVTQQFGWYLTKDSEQLAWRFFTTVDLTLSKLARLPDLGRIRRFQNPLLRGF